MNQDQKILLSGVKPTGRVHFGNYFGAIKQFVELQTDYETFVMIADYHALTGLVSPDDLRQNILDITLDYLALGLDPEQVFIFQQSNVSEHTELAWIFNCLATMPYLARAHAYKDAVVKNKEINVGVFTYPLLMAADILLYDPSVVPVGQDQKQHIEIARDLAEKFNHLYGETFHLPEPLIMDEVKTVIGLDGQKMSKSYNNAIPVFAEPMELKRLVMSIVTDSKNESEPKNPEECNVFALHKLFSEKDLPELKRRYVEGKIGYRESKELLLQNINNFLEPKRARRAEFAANPERVRTILAQGAEAARARAGEKMRGIREKIGLNI